MFTGTGVCLSFVCVFRFDGEGTVNERINRPNINCVFQFATVNAERRCVSAVSSVSVEKRNIGQYQPTQSGEVTRITCHGGTTVFYPALLFMYSIYVYYVYINSGRMLGMLLAVWLSCFVVWPFIDTKYHTNGGEHL